VIARRYRLRRSSEFERVRRRGRSVSNRLLVVSFAANQLGENRYGFAIGRRVGKAVRRNKVKRWLREAVRRLHPRLRQGFDIVLVARGALADPAMTYHRVVAAVEELLDRAGLVSAESTEPDSEREHGVG
jgi:ribonuclease P protein component